ncbi:hypothetical protein EVAR_67508_1 [Eumeta japonica]|uniref:Reverse transcriptase domain-containing protein n=1 Tax=Eumeta variegata TaxID=151549 RepID=A0A4C1ZWH6_EUMVA|nr:hypothetical protein EVAR_67508_1 [Eumeta japonica]
MLRGGGGIVANVLYQLFNKFWKCHKALQFLHRCSSACIRINRAYIDWSHICRGVRHLCVASPWLFDLFMDSCLYNLKEYECELRMDELFVKCFMYADNKVIVAPSACGLQEMLNKMNGSVKKSGMKVHVSKTKVMAFKRGKVLPGVAALSEA